jgi:hypothetical protein
MGHAPQPAALVTLPVSGKSRHEERKMTKHAGKPTAQKQHAIDELVRKAIGSTRAVAKMIGRRYGSDKWGSYQQYLTEDGHTAFVNLDADPITVKVSEKPNAMHFARYKRQLKRAEERLAKKAAKETQKAETLKATKKSKKAVESK